MKKVLWIACLLCMMPFLGYTQMHAGLAPQDDETVFGQPPVSKELPSHIELRNIIRTTNNRDGADPVWAHAMFIPPHGYTFGRYYEVTESGQINQRTMYNNWYYSSAEYFTNSSDPAFSVWAYAEDYVQGFMNLNYEMGNYNQGYNTSVTLSMNDITYDYNHSRMLGTKHGRIYNVIYDGDQPGKSELLYDYAEHDNLKPIAIACDLDGTLYFVSTSIDGTENSKLYKFESDDVDLTEPILVGDLDWPARSIQTMAFNHKTRELFWWANDKDGKSQLKKINKEDGVLIENVTDVLTTGIGGLIFQFDYIPYTATCINTEGELLLDNGQTVNTYLPGKDVTVTVTAPECMSLEELIVMEAAHHENIIATIPADELVNGTASFVMPACDVDIDAVWVGNEHNITVTYTCATKPNIMTEMPNLITTNPAGVGECGETVTVNWQHPEGYILTSLTATPNCTLSTPNNYKCTFTMPDNDVQVKGTWVYIISREIEDMCQYEPLKNIPPQEPCTLNSPHTHTYYFKKPGSSSWIVLNETQMADGNTFNVPGTWQYYAAFHNQYGTFNATVQSFQVYAAPKSIAIEGNQYNCDGDSIVLNVVPTPADAVMNGNYVWTKDGNEIATTTEPKLILDPITTDDAGIYNVIYTPATENEAADAEPVCEFTVEGGYPVNVATLPNDPIVRIKNGQNPICYDSPVEIEWDHGVLNPDEYEFQWYTVDEDDEWTAIEGATGYVYETASLVENTTFGLSIHYAGEYYLCHAESQPFTVEVKEQTFLEFEGDMETCQGYTPDNNPRVVGDFTSYYWVFDGQQLGETSNELHFEDSALNGDLVDVAGTYVVTVSAIDAEGCTINGEFEFTVKELPDVMIVNNITDDTAHYNDNPVLTINVCAGSSVQLTALGASQYRWDPTSETTDVINLQPMESTTYSVSGLDAETGCWNTTTINIVVSPRPEITWVVPSADTTFSMITNNFQLQATPEGGVFTYIIEGDPMEIDYPIENGLFNPAMLGLGEFQLVYSYQDENGCDNEEKINITIEKPYWTDPDKWDPEWYDACVLAHRFEITNPAQMGSFMAYVYGLNGVEQTDFAGDTIWITNNIDLLEMPYFYRPFCDTAMFAGVLDGTGKVVTNMTILEDNLQMHIDGWIRNVGVKDANITSIGEPCVVDLLEDAMLHNSYVTMPNLDNVTPNLHPSGEVRNVYYYGDMGGQTNAIYIDNAYAFNNTSVCEEKEISGETEEVFITPITPEELLTNLGGNPPVYEGILEEWVWIQNDFIYRDWVTDGNDELSMLNHGYPYLHEQFVHHHYTCLTEDCYGVGQLNGTEVRTINSLTTDEAVDYEYAMNGDLITYVYTPESDYVVVDSIMVEALNYNGEKDSVFYVKGPAYEFEFTMPTDSIYLPAYTLRVTPISRRTYWTDEGNYNEEWYQACVDANTFEITSNEDLAAFAYMVNFGGENFEGDTIHITGSETLGSEIIDMSGHYWKPIYNFAGVLDGTHYIVDNLFINENNECDAIQGVDSLSAMFVNCTGSIINMGLQDMVLPTEGTVASYMINNTPNAVGSVINSFATTDPALGLEIELAVGENVTVTNSYTLDAGGNMIDHNHEGIDFAALHQWVVNTSAEMPLVFWDWKLDDQLINYNYPVHSEQYDGGWAITYDPDILNPVNGYVSGPATAHENEVITVGIYPDWCYDMQSLTVDMGNEVIDISNTKTFTMPNNPVTVSAVFVPKNWKLTVNYVTLAGESLGSDVYPNMHLDDEILVADYAKEFEDYELVEDMNQDATMICGNMTITYTYQGKMHNISFCEEDATVEPEYHVTYTTDPEGEARYGETVALTVTVEEEGVTIMGVTITDAEGNEVPYTGSNGEFSFVMPTSDVTICASFDEEYWDDRGPADITWYLEDPNKTEYVLTTDSMLGGLAALVTGRDWIVEDELIDAETLATIDFAGVTIIVNSEQEEGEINLIEHKWRPIGAQIEFLKQFQGIFDGNGHIITNMRTVDITHYNEEFNGSCQGFFGTVGENGIVNDVNIQGTAEGRYFTAGVAAVNYGLIMNCVADVQVKSEFQAGGIVCNNYSSGYVINSYCISDHVECISAAPNRDNPTNNYYVGGVASFNEGTIINCHSAAQLIKGNGTNPINYYGGVVGMNEGEVANCYWVVNPIEPGMGGGNGLFTDCAVIDDNTADLMTATAEDLIEQFELDFFTWTDGTEGYPVFDLTSRNVMNSNDNQLEVVLYPNPTKDIVKIFSNNIQRVTVYNMFGQMVLDNQVNGNETTIRMNGLSAGVYMVKVTTAEGIATRNVVLE